MSILTSEATLKRIDSKRPNFSNWESRASWRRKQCRLLIDRFKQTAFDFEIILLKCEKKNALYLLYFSNTWVIVRKSLRHRYLKCISQSSNIPVIVRILIYAALILIIVIYNDTTLINIQAVYVRVLLIGIIYSPALIITKLSRCLHYLRLCQTTNQLLKKIMLLFSFLLCSTYHLLYIAKGGYTRSHFLNMYLSVLHEHIRGNTCCYRWVYTRANSHMGSWVWSSLKTSMFVIVYILLVTIEGHERIQFSYVVVLYIGYYNM